MQSDPSTTLVQLYFCKAMAHCVSVGKCKIKPKALAAPGWSWDFVPGGLFDCQKKEKQLNGTHEGGWFLRIWWLRFPLLLNAWPHSRHRNGRLLVWVRLWFIRLLLCEKRFPHTLQMCGFSLVCTLLCTIRVPERVKHLPHTCNKIPHH